MDDRGQLVPRALWSALVLIIVFLAGFAIFSARTTQVQVQAAQLSNGLARAYSDARHAVATEESLERKYRLEPGPDILDQHRQAGRSLVQALRLAAAHRDPTADPTTSTVLAAHTRYLDATAALFAAVDAGDAALAQRIDTESVDPVFHEIQQRVYAAADEHSADAAASLEALHQTEEWIFALTLLVFPLGMGLLVLVWRLFMRYRRAADERFRAVVQNATDVIVILSVDGRVMYASPAAQTRWDHLPDDGRLIALAHPDDVSVARACFAEALAAPTGTVRTQLRLAGPDQQWRSFDIVVTNLLGEPAVGGLVVTFHDVTDQKAHEEQLAHLALHDTLTGLPNRTLVLDRLAQALARRPREPSSVAVLFLDVDNLKVVNDSLGHETGDQMLAEVAHRLRVQMRAGDTVGRVSGDEFVAVLDGIAGATEAVVVARRIADAIHQPMLFASHEIVIQASTGIAVAQERDTSDALVRKADLAMYRAKAAGAGGVAMFDEEMGRNALDQLELQTDLRHAVERGELRVYYQPIVALADGSLHGLEALVRWEHPTRGLLLPGAFIDIAERNGLIIEIGRWVLQQALAQLAAWGESARKVRVSINLSARQLRDAGLVADVACALEASRVGPERLQLEVTESVVMEDAEEGLRQLQALHALGIRLAIDDFGIGHSSLGYLSRLPIDTLKIDRLFVNEIERGAKHDIALLRGIVALAHSLALGIVAEGIETDDQRRALALLGCELGQGYLFAHATPASEIDQLLSAGSPTEAIQPRAQVLAGTAGPS